MRRPVPCETELVSAISRCLSLVTVFTVVFKTSIYLHFVVSTGLSLDTVVNCHSLGDPKNSPSVGESFFDSRDPRPFWSFFLL